MYLRTASFTKDRRNNETKNSTNVKFLFTNLRAKGGGERVCGFCIFWCALTVLMRFAATWSLYSIIGKQKTCSLERERVSERESVCVLYYIVYYNPMMTPFLLHLLYYVNFSINSLAALRASLTKVTSRISPL